MRVFREHGVSVGVVLIEIERIELVLRAEGCAGVFVPADDLLLKGELNAVPVFEGHADLANNQVRPTAHPVGRFGAGPDNSFHRLWVGGAWVDRAVLEAHQIAWRSPVAEIRNEA